MGPLLPDKVDCHHQIIGRSAAHGDVARHRLAQDPTVVGTFLQAMLVLLVLGRGDEQLHEPPQPFCFTPHYSLIYVFLLHLKKASVLFPLAWIYQPSYSYAFQCILPFLVHIVIHLTWFTAFVSFFFFSYRHSTRSTFSIDASYMIYYHSLGVLLVFF
jgi:hypothetical protein